MGSGNFNTKKTKKQNGLMKNGTDWHPSREGVFLSSKCYSLLVKYLTELYKQKMTAKGVKSSLHKDLNHILYKKVAGVLNEDEKEELKIIVNDLKKFKIEDNSVTGNQKSIQTNKEHQLYTIEMSKVLLNNFNDKRFDEKYAYGHHETLQEESN